VRRCALPWLQPGRPVDHIRAATHRGQRGSGFCRLPPGQRGQQHLRLRLERVLW